MWCGTDMDKSLRERNALMMNHLIQERQKIEDLSVTRIDRDYKKLYDYITEEIAKLNLELFQSMYQQYESTLNQVLGIEEKSDAVS
jgi:uncharacterized protein YozE (UPF0346 family)